MRSTVLDVRRITRRYAARTVLLPTAGERHSRLGSRDRTARRFRPALFVHIAALLRRDGLDRRLIGGADPAEVALLAPRAAQLTRRETRTRLAAALELLVRSAGKPPRRVHVRPSPAAVLSNRDDLLGLAAKLRGANRLHARGLAMLEVLVTDGARPVYTDPGGDELARPPRRWSPTDWARDRGGTRSGGSPSSARLSSLPWC